MIEKHKFYSFTVNNSVLAIIYVIIALFLYAFSDNLIKLTEINYDTGQKTWIRSVMRTIPIMITMLLYYKCFDPLKTERPVLHLLNSVIGCARTYIFMFALGAIPLAEVSIFGYTSAFFYALLAVIFLNEKIQKHHIIIMLIATLGICISLYPQFSSSTYTTKHLIGCVMTIAGAFFASASKVMMRNLSFKDNPLSMVVYPNLFLIITFAPNVLSNWQSVTNCDWLIFAIIGITAAIGQYAFAKAVSLTTGLTLAPYDYTYFVWAFIMDWVFTNTLPNPWVMFGGIFIVGSSIISLYYEFQNKKKIAL